MPGSGVMPLFEIYYLPMNVEMGAEQPEIPTMLVSLPPRRVQRSRSQDVTGIFLTVVEGRTPPIRFLEGLLDEAISAYYTSPGSTTNGLKTAADQLNKLLTEFNAGLSIDQKGQPVMAAVNMVVLKGNLLSIMHAGASHTWLLQPNQLQDFESDAEQGKGLGKAGSVPVRFFQTQLDPEAMVLFCTQPPADWTEASLTHGQRLTINSLRRRLLGSADSFQTGLMQLKPSDVMAVKHLRLRSVSLTELVDPSAANMPANSPISEKTADSPVAPELKPTASIPQPQVQPDGNPEEPPVDDIAKRPPVMSRRVQPGTETSYKRSTAPTAQPARSTEPVTFTSVPSRAAAARERALANSRVSAQAVPVASETDRLAPDGTVPEHTSQPEPDPERELERAARQQANRKMLASAWQWLHGRQKKTGQAAGQLLTRLVPGSSEETSGFSKGFYLLIAILIPLLVVLAAVSIYFQQGRDEQHQMYLNQAGVYAAQAREAEDATVIRNHWEQALYWLDLAEEYSRSEASQRLRREANATLDALEGVARLNFQDLYPYGFDSKMNFTQIAVNDTDVYLLDSESGGIERLVMTGKGYELDENFSCKPGISGTLVLGNFIDMAALPAGSPNKASVMAIDSGGNVAYCIPGQAAPFTAQLPAPEKGWGKIAAVTLYQGTLYVLDIENSQVYYFTGFTSGYGEEAKSFFDAERDPVIPEMTNMIDLAVNGEDMYLLNRNGTMAHCTSGIWEINQTRCDDPASFGDMRLIQSDNTLLFEETLFTQMQTSSQPEPSLYLLDPQSSSIFRFSLQLNLDRLFRPDTATDVEIPKTPVTAFAITPTREVFIAYGNQVFYAAQQN